MHISLRQGEKLYLNGAVLRADRKMSIELLNDATFLLEGHVMQVEETTTPLRQLYFVVQSMLMDPANANIARTMFARQLAALNVAFSNDEVLSQLDDVARLVGDDRCFEALRTLRGLFPLEDAIVALPAIRAAARQESLAQR